MFWVIQNQYNNSKRYKVLWYHLPKGTINNYNVIINGKNFYDQAIDFDIKRYEEIRNLTTAQGEDYTTGCLIKYEYIKDHCRWKAVDLSKQKELNTHPKVIKQIEFVRQLKILIVKMLMVHNLCLF